MELDRYFPYLKDGSMSEEERLKHLQILYRESETIKARFGLLIQNLQKDLEKNSKLEDSVKLLTFYDRDLEDKLSDCTSFGLLFQKITEFVSFFDYKYMEILVEHLGSSEIKKKFKKYKSRFQEFAKCHICECPSDLFDKSENSDSASKKSQKTYVIKINKSMAKLTLEDLEELKCKMNEILERKLLKIVKVENGCVQVTFITFTSNDFVISDEQKRALSSLGVITISCGSETVYIPTVSSPENKDNSGKSSDKVLIFYIIIPLISRVAINSCTMTSLNAQSFWSLVL